MDTLSRLYQSDNRNRLLLLTLLPLQLVIWHTDLIWLEYLLMAAHFTLLILWHPFWLGDIYLRRPSSLLLAGVGLFVTISHSHITLSLWLAILASMLAGEPLRQRREITVQVTTVIYLLIGLFASTLPASVEAPQSTFVRASLGYLSLLPLAVLAMVPQGRKYQLVRQVDMLLSLLFLLVTLVIALGTIALCLNQTLGYFTCLGVVALAATLAIGTINVLWKRFAGTSALSFLWNRYLLILGSPFETLLVKFSALAKTTPSPSQYLETCFIEMKQLEWIDGIQWQASSGRGTVGSEEGYKLEIELADLSVILYSKQAIRSGLSVHARLIIHLITHFYHSIKRERSQAHRAHVQALYETGARLTHDIKNLLQGLKTLAVAGEHTTDPEAFHALFLKQMPTINERLETTLRKLTEPSQSRRDRDVKVGEWWQQLEQRYRGRDIELSANIEVDRAIPVEMFNTVSENLLENARAKRLHERRIEIRAEVISNPDGLVFSVTDTGYPVDQDKAQFLLSEPVKSEQGLGVGLYQAAALAKHQGYTLSLETNVEGMVCFTLSSGV